MSANPRVTILGGGFGGLETAFHLRHRLGDRVDLRLVSERDHFQFKPNTIYIPFGDDPLRFRIPLAEPTRRQDIEFVQGHARGIDTERKTVEVGRERLAYDYLVVATGADMRPDEIPGLAEHAHTLWTPEAMLELRPALAGLVEAAQAKQSRQLLFLIPPNNRCASPLYEMAMMIDTWLRRAGARQWRPGSNAAHSVEITWTTCEESFLQAFGPRMNTVVRQEFDERDIRGFCGQVVSHVEPGKVHYHNGIVREFDLLIAFPPYVAGTRFPGLPSDDRGFVHVDPDSRRVAGSPDVFAVGDAADFPIKQAFLALLQGDAAAEHVAADIEGRKPAFAFEPMSMCVMEELNKATFVQVPLRYTGDSARPVEVDTEDSEHYKVGVSPLWRVGKTALGLYLPWRFGRGEPFHAGMAWEAMDLGLKVMAKALAR